MWGFLAALASAVLMAIGRDTGQYGWLMLIAPVPLMVWSLKQDKAWPVAALAFAAGLAGETGPMLYYGRILALIYAMAVLQALLFMGAVLFLRRLYRRGWVALAPLGYAAMIVAIEYIYGLVSPNGSFGALGYDLVDVLPLLQSASLGGLGILSFLAAIVPAGLAIAILEPRDIRAWAVWTAPVAAALAFGFWSLGQPMGETFKVALVSDDRQVGIAEHRAEHDDEVTAAFEHAFYTQTDRDADFVVLPEKMFVMSDASELSSLAGGPQVVAGIDADAPSSPGRRLNLALLFRQHQNALTYSKQHMVPGLESRYVPGHQPLIVDDNRPDARVGVAICKDMDFAGTLRVYGQHDVRLMLLPAWDFGADRYLHGRMAVVRAVENGFALARTASEGLMTVSDSHGRIIAEKATRRGLEVLTAEVPLGRGHSVYSQIGDAFAQLLTAVWVGLWVLLIWRRKVEA